MPKEIGILSNIKFYIRDCILNEASYAACEGSKKNHMLGGHCVIAEAGNSRLVRKRCSLNKWDSNNVQTTEGCLFK